jgi:hypothetical protein
VVVAIDANAKHRWGGNAARKDRCHPQTNRINTCCWWSTVPLCATVEPCKISMSAKVAHIHTEVGTTYSPAWNSAHRCTLDSQSNVQLVHDSIERMHGRVAWIEHDWHDAL